VLEAVTHLKVRSCLIDGEVVCCDESGVSSFDRIRYRRHDASVFPYALD
jgi:bifunctional non-homologous end joining protein LigD